MTTPAASAAVNGPPGNLDATNASAQINQHLGTHAVTEIYDGVRIVSGASGGHFVWLPTPPTLDFAQPFTMSGTNIGQLALPLNPVGNGADVLVSLWPDNGSGQPNTTGSPIASVKVSAAYLLQVSATSGLVNGGPLATERDNYINFSNTNVVPWSAPSNDPSGATSQAVACYSGNFLIMLGGFPGSGIPVAAVNTAEYLGNTQLSAPIPQQPLPQTLALGAATTTTSAVFYFGGNSSAGTPIANVWGASWSSNTGSIGAWSSQTALPQSIYHLGAASWGDHVYVIAGVTGTPTTLNTVYWNTADNGILGAWGTGPLLPAALSDPLCAVVGNWLVVFGGRTDTSSSTPLTGVYYAPIGADGSLGPWQVGPPLPSGSRPFASGWGACATADHVMQLSGHGEALATFRALPFTANGPGQRWVTGDITQTGDLIGAAFDDGDGNWSVIMALPEGTPPVYSTANVIPMPYVSLPFYATGLTDGATYHIVTQASGTGSASDSTQLGVVDGAVYPAACLQSPRHGGTWTAIASGDAVPMRMFDATPGGPLRHTWEDPSASGLAQRWSTLLYNSQSLLVGHLESTLMANPPLNSNPTFTSGVSPWTATNGTLTQSSAQTQGGFAFSGLLTPTGGSAQAFAASEQVPVQQGGGPFYGASQWYLADGWFYSPPGWPSFQLNVNWFDRLGGYLSTTSGATVNLSAGVWTHVQAYAEAPATAAFGQLVPTQFGSPGATRLLYCSDVFLVQSPECVGAVTSAAVVDYPTSGAPWPPTGVTQLL